MGNQLGVLQCSIMHLWDGRGNMLSKGINELSFLVEPFMRRKCTLIASNSSFGIVLIHHLEWRLSIFMAPTLRDLWWPFGPILAAHSMMLCHFMHMLSIIWLSGACMQFVVLYPSMVL